MYEVTALGTIVTTNELEDDLHTGLLIAGGIEAKLRACLPDNLTMQNIWVQIVGPARFGRATYPLGGDGTLGADTLTANTAAVIVRRGEDGNRRAISTLHLVAPVAVDLIEAGIIVDAGYKALLTSLAAEMLDNITGPLGGATFKPVIWNPADPAAFSRRIVRSFAQDTLRVMRRRTVGLGI